MDPLEFLGMAEFAARQDRPVGFLLILPVYNLSLIFLYNAYLECAAWTHHTQRIMNCSEISAMRNGAKRKVSISGEHPSKWSLCSTSKERKALTTKWGNPILRESCL